MAELSIFIDESGDFGKYSENSPYYIITLVFHNQDISIKDDIAKLDKAADNVDGAVEGIISRGNCDEAMNKYNWGDNMVTIGNEWDEILKDEFAKEYYLKLREFLKQEYFTE